MILLWLSPLAYVGGVWLYAKQDAAAQVGFKVDREQALERARQYTLSKGLATAKWNSLCKIQPYNERYFYYRFKHTPRTNQPTLTAPIAAIRILFTAPDKKENIQLWMNPEGDVIGYLRSFLYDPNLAEIDVTKARSIAELALQSRPEAGSISRDNPPAYNEVRSDGNLIRKYSWDWTLPAFPELKTKTIISVRGNQVIGEEITSELNPEFARQNLKLQEGPLVVIITIYIILSMALVIFGIFRFTARLRQKEVSFGRIILIALAVTATYGGFLFLTDVSVFDAATIIKVSEASWLNRLFSFLTWLMIGVMLGFAYGSGEGDLREAYPGKLTSLDTLMVGKIFSLNAAQALIHGTAISGWLFLANQLSIYIFSRNSIRGFQLTSLESFFAHLPWLFALISWPASSLVNGIFVLLLPLPFLNRRLKKSWLVLTILFLIALIPSSLGNIASLQPWTLSILPTLITTAVLLYSFFRFDLLTAIVAIGAYDLAAFAFLFMSQPSSDLRFSGTIVTVIAIVSLVAAIYFYFKGRFYEEDEVRPLYASNLAERLSLQAEVSAAREAQIRLLPDKLPEIPRLSIAAACQPAHEVGGDFYELFQLEPGKLGIFMAEGGGRGLAAALTIAFAKGYLMPRIKNDSLGDNTPTEIVRKLKSQLLKTMAQDEGLGFIYMVIDTSDQTLRFAGAGDFPIPKINQQNTTEAQRQGEERDIFFKVNEETNFQLRQGIYYLQPGDTVSLLTDGARKISDHNSASNNFWKRVSDKNKPDTDLQTSLISALREAARQFPEIKDDMTAVIVRFDSKEDL